MILGVERLPLLALAIVISLGPNLLGQDAILWHQLKLRGSDGQNVDVNPNGLTVACFLGTECPLARLYGPRLQALADRFAPSGVNFLGINSNVQDSPAEIDAYAKLHGIQFPIVKDADQSVAEAIGATRTPEVFVINPQGLILYQGRIDDQYEPGVSRAQPKQHNLRDAIEAAIDNRPIDQPITAGVGCLITRVKKSKADRNADDEVTFNRDIAPILNQHCVECHRDGEIAPMALTDYDEVVGWGQMILEVIDQHRMPPWHADPDVGHFVGERRMPSASRDTIAAWLDSGMPQGDHADLPSLPTWPQGWQFTSPPDFEIAMRERPFNVPADGVVEYQYFVVDPEWSEDRWIRAAQVVPGDSSVVHHAIVFVRPPDDRGFQGIGWMAAYVPGQRAVSLPEGHARLVPAGSKLVFQMHYTPNGQPTADITRVGIWQADAESVTHEVFTQLAIDHEFEIPPGVKDFVVDMTVDSFPPKGRMLGITPHMHLRGKSFRLVAEGQDGLQEPLLNVPQYDFNWQHWYEFETPVNLERLASLNLSVTFDNSASNPFNPAPEDYVSWGDQTWEEMAVAFFDVAVPRGGAHRGMIKRTPLSEDEIALLQQRVDKQVDAFFAKMDTNGDGIIERDEAPIAFRRFGFNQIDRNYDGRIERDEVRQEAGERL